MPLYISHSAEDTYAIGYSFGQQIVTPMLLCFFGELAAGKTTFIKGLVAGATNLSPSVVQSPTFTYLHIYEGEKVVYHFDLYRLHGIEEFVEMGFDEYFYEEAICCIEWSERIFNALPPTYTKITLQHMEQEQRLITIQPFTKEKSYQN